MTNMETLDMPAASGVDCSVIILGDYSNGNDAILVRDKLTLGSLKNRKIYLAERTVSQYLLTRDARSTDAVGILYPDGTVSGDKRNIKMRYVDTFMAEAAAGNISLQKEVSPSRFGYIPQR
jgi:hypothetical protein